MEEIKQIIKSIKDKNLAPLYFLMGEEPYYIDKIADYIEDNILTEEEKGFNQMILYGRDVTMQEVISNAKRFPLMAEKQVIIVKEAQDLSRTIDQLESYLLNLQPSTVLVFCYKYGNLDKRKKVYKAIQKYGVLFESKKLRDYQMDTWLKRQVATKGYAIENKAAQMLVEFLGTDLTRIDNELAKLGVLIPKGGTVTADVVEKNIGISKDFNNFELLRAIIAQDRYKAYQIADYFALNPRNNPMVVTIGIVYAYFSKLLLYHGLADKSTKNAATQMKVQEFLVKDYAAGVRIYPMKRVSAIVAHLKDIDLKSKGVGANALPQGELLKEMLIKLF